MTDPTLAEIDALLAKVKPLSLTHFPFREIKWLRALLAAETERAKQAEFERDVAISVMQTTELQLDAARARAEQAEAEAARLRRALIGIAHTHIDTEGGLMMCLPANEYQEMARAALAEQEAPRDGE